MDELVLTAATTLSVTPIDIYVIAWAIFIWGILMIMGIQKTYEIAFGLVVGLAIYLMLTVLLSPAYQTVDTIGLISPRVSTFLIGSSVYLMFILMVLTPLSWGIRFPYTNTRMIRVFEHMIVGFWVIAFFAALVIGFTSRTYIFGIETGFVLLGKTLIYGEMIRWVVLGYVAAHLQPFVLFSVLYLLYKILFSEIAGVLVLTLWYWIMSLRLRSRGGRYAEPVNEELLPEADFGELDHGGHDDHAPHDDHGHKAH